MNDLVKALRSGEQADMDGTLVKVSRQACEEAADAIEALQAQLAEARDDAAFVAAQLQAVLDMSPPPQEGILKKRLHELAARKNALAEARDKALEEAARVADRIMDDYAEMTYSPHHDRMQNAAKTYCAGEIAAAIRALKKK